MSFTKTKTQKVSTSALLVGNILTVIFFIYYGGSVLQVLWIYLIQSIIAALFYYRRISKIRFAELGYYKKHVPTKAIKFEKEVQHQIPGEQLAILIICIGPLIMLVLILLAFSVPETGSVANSDIFLPRQENISVYAILASGLAFAIGQYADYFNDLQLARHGQKLINRYSSFFRATLALIPLGFIFIFGTFIYSLTDSAGLFLCFMIVKTGLDILISLKLSHLNT